MGWQAEEIRRLEGEVTGLRDKVQALQERNARQEAVIRMLWARLCRVWKSAEKARKATGTADRPDRRRAPSARERAEAVFRG